MANVILKNPGSNMIAVIKEVRSLMKTGLKESKDLVEAAAAGRDPVVLKDVNLERARAALAQLTAAGARGVVEEGAPAATGAAAIADQVWDGAAPAGAAGGNGYGVYLIDSGKNKIAVIKALRELTGFGLKEAKDLSELRGGFVREGLTKAQAEAGRALLVAEGAQAEVR